VARVHDTTSAIVVARRHIGVWVAAVPTDAEREPDELLSYAEQEVVPQHGGPTSAAAQRREADHVEAHREGEGDPLSGDSRNVHPRSRRASGGRGQHDDAPAVPDQSVRP
jgi:hypothetical protein